MANSNNIRIIISAEDRASKPLRQVASEVDKTSDRTARFSSLLRGTYTMALGTATAGTAALSGGLVAAAKSSYDQVKAVEEARFGLLAYEKDAAKANRVLSDLVEYAQSDMGVLFNRKDMFAAASTLKMYGNETGTLTERVRILSKGVAQGKTTFQELSAIVGRAAAKGRLDAVDFDMLIERGIGLDRRFRGASVSADELWKALNKALPDELLKGRAETIEGRMIRLQSAFRGVGNEVLGVDKVTNNFIAGGLGDRIQKGISGLTDFLKQAAPVVGSSIKTILGTFDLLRTGEFKDGMFGPAIKQDSMYVDVLLNVRDTVQKVHGFIAPKFAALGAVVAGELAPALQNLWQGAVVPLAGAVGGAFVVAFGAAVDVLKAGVSVASGLINTLTPLMPLFVALGAGMAAYKASVVALNAANLVTATYQAATNAQFLLYNGVLIKAQASTVAQTVAMTALNTVMKLNPFGLAIAGITALGGALLASAQQTDATRGAQDRLNQARDRARVLTEELRTAEYNLRDAQLGATGAALAVERAQRTYNDTLAKYGPHALETREAAYYLEQAERDLADANSRVRDETEKKRKKEQEVNDARSAVKKAEEDKRGYLDGTTMRINAQRTELEKLREEWSKEFNWSDSQKNANTLRNNLNKVGQPRTFGKAVGTNYHSGGWSLVGEHGPERIRVPRGAEITPAYQTRQEGAGNASQVVVQIGEYHVHHERDEKKAFEDMGFALLNAT